jgi:hypothetical protein
LNAGLYRDILLDGWGSEEEVPYSFMDITGFRILNFTLIFLLFDIPYMEDETGAIF